MLDGTYPVRREIAPGAWVHVRAYGEGVRAADCGLTRQVIRINRTRVVILDADGRERAVGPRCLAVVR